MIRAYNAMKLQVLAIMQRIIYCNGGRLNDFACFTHDEILIIRFRVYLKHAADEISVIHDLKIF